VAVGGAVYGLSCLALGAVSLRELSQVLHHIVHRGEADALRAVELSASGS
jgi:hypothetical protein